MPINSFINQLRSVRLTLKGWPCILAIFCCAAIWISAIIASPKRLPKSNDIVEGKMTGKEGNRLSSASTKPLTGISINLTRFGFEPSEITIPEGGYFISVRNLTQRTDVSFILENNSRVKLLEEAYRNGARGWDKVLNLPPGDYLLREGTNQNWRLNIKVLSSK